MYKTSDNYAKLKISFEPFCIMIMLQLPCTGTKGLSVVSQFVTSRWVDMVKDHTTDNLTDCSSDDLLKSWGLRANTDQAGTWSCRNIASVFPIGIGVHILSLFLIGVIIINVVIQVGAVKRLERSLACIGYELWKEMHTYLPPSLTEVAGAFQVGFCRVIMAGHWE